MATMRQLVFSVCLMGSVLLAGCASNVSYDYNPDYPFASQDTFAFDTKTKTGASSLDERRLRTAIEQALATKGVRESSDAADVRVRYRIEDTRRLESSGLSFGFGIGAGHGGIGVSTAPPAREVKEGQLVLEIIDPARDEVIWSAVSRRNLRADMEPRERAKFIEEIVREMLANYPPQPKS